MGVGGKPNPQLPAPNPARSAPQDFSLNRPQHCPPNQRAPGVNQPPIAAKGAEGRGIAAFDPGFGGQKGAFPPRASLFALRYLEAPRHQDLTFRRPPPELGRIRRTPLPGWLPELPNDSQNDFLARPLTDHHEPRAREAVERQGAFRKSERTKREQEPDERGPAQVGGAKGGVDERRRRGDRARVAHPNVRVAKEVVEEGAGSWVLGAGDTHSNRHPAPSTQSPASSTQHPTAPPATARTHNPAPPPAAGRSGPRPRRAPRPCSSGRGADSGRS